MSANNSAATLIITIGVGLAMPRLAMAQADPVVPAGPLLAATASADEIPPGQIRFRSFGPTDGLRNLAVVSIV